MRTERFNPMSVDQSQTEKLRAVVRLNTELLWVAARPKGASAESRTRYAVNRTNAYRDSIKIHKDVWLLFKRDFTGWDEDMFSQLEVLPLELLRHTLRELGVYIERDDRPAPVHLAELQQREEYEEWPVARETSVMLRKIQQQQLEKERTQGLPKKTDIILDIKKHVKEDVKGNVKDVKQDVEEDVKVDIKQGHEDVDIKHTNIRITYTPQTNIQITCPTNAQTTPETNIQITYQTDAQNSPQIGIQTIYPTTIQNIHQTNIQITYPTDAQKTPHTNIQSIH
ncbi:hypothetical protein PVAG01_09840 [Phlyctema vagabunda]|uniref:Uncharacterized protein n=1 Tax=Phlyctema vagabunda TaxID=108571 RepID=A0ABR4P4A1_9HELO